MADNVIFTYQKNPDYRIKYANGAFGGVTPKGEIKFDLFVEYLQNPEETVHSMTPDGLGPEIDRTPEKPPIVRESQVGIIMSIGEAKSLAAWLMQRVNTYEQRNK
jgi:hypothetical protein